MIKNRDFNILFIGRLIANFGDSLYVIATMLLVFKLTGSTLYVGVALFLTSSMAIVQVILSPLLDRINMKRYLVLAQLIQSILLLTIPVLYHFDQLAVYQILIIMPIITLVNQLIYPGQISLLPKILKKEELIKANSLFTIAYQGSDALFTAIAGFLITFVGVYFVYYIDSLAFLINSILFLFLSQKVATVNKKERDNERSNLTKRECVKMYFNDFSEGMKIWKDDILLPILIGIIIINFATTSIYANLPSYASTEVQYSFLMGAAGLGVLIGSIIVSKFKLNRFTLNKIYISSIFLIGLSWLATSQMIHPSLTMQIISVFTFFLGWVPIGILNVLSQTMVQLSVPTEKLGVVMGSMVGVSTLLAPLGALIGGFLGQLIGSSETMLFSSLMFVLVGIYWLSKSSIRNLPKMENLPRKEVIT